MKKQYEPYYQTPSVPAQVWSAGLYIRLSREDEQKGESNSVSSQREILREYVKQHPDIIEYDCYIDDGWTGTNFDRPGFQRMMEDIRMRKINCVIVKDLSRFGRNANQGGTLITEDFVRLGVRFIACNNYYDSLTASASSAAATNCITLGITNVINESVSATTSVNVRATLNVNRQQGKFIGSFSPYGYLKDPNDYHKLIVDPETAPIVRDIFHRVLSGMSYKGVFAAIRAAHPEFRHSYSAFRALVARPCYAGIRNGILGSCPAYITMDQRNQLLTLTGTRSPRRPDQVYLFTGMMRCPECGGKLSAGRTDGYVYYYCRKHRVDKKCPCTISLREDRIERALTASLFQPGEIVVDSVKASQNAEKHVQTASEIERKMKRLAETYTDGLIDRDTYKAKLAALTEHLEAVRMAPSRPSEPVSERVREFLHGDIQTVYERLERQEKRAFWLKVVHTVTMDADFSILGLY